MQLRLGVVVKELSTYVAELGVGARPSVASRLLRSSIASGDGDGSDAKRTCDDVEGTINDVEETNSHTCGL